MGVLFYSLLKHILLFLKILSQLSKIKDQEVKMGNSGVILLLCTLAFSSATVGPIDLCGRFGCCGTGMHTPAADGSYTGVDNRVDNHLYTIYDPRVDGEETWDYWDLNCRVTSVEGGKTGKVVVLESMAELDCLIEYMND